MRSLFSILLVTMLAHIGWSQIDSTTQDAFIYHPCPPISSLVYPGDSLSRKGSAIDSLYALLQGRWKLILTGGRWGYPTKPKKETEIHFDQRGKGTVYENGIMVSEMNITLRREWKSFLFDVEEEGKSLFYFMTLLHDVQRF